MKDDIRVRYIKSFTIKNLQLCLKFRLLVI